MKERAGIKGKVTVMVCRISIRISNRGRECRPPATLGSTYPFEPHNTVLIVSEVSPLCRVTHKPSRTGACLFWMDGAVWLEL